MLFRYDQHLEDGRKLCLHFRLRLQCLLRIPDKTELRWESTVLLLKIKTDKIHGTGIVLYMRKDRRTGMVQLMGVFFQMFFAKALQMIQYLRIGGV